MSNNALIQHLIKTGALKSEHIIKAFLCADRKDFVPEDLKEDAYIDAPLPIGFGQTISQPYTVAFMLELLAPQKGHKILDIGPGSGWTSALLACIVDGDGFVYGIEIIKELVKFSKDNLSKYNFDNLKIEQANPQVLGAPQYAPFDRILVNAASNEFKEELLEQLKDKGIIVAPVKNSLVRAIKENGHVEYEEFPGFSFVSLV